MPTTIYKGEIGKTVSLVITDDDGDAVSLTNSTVTLDVYPVGSQTASKSFTCSVDDAANGLASYTSTLAADFGTVGMFYSRIKVAYTGGNILYFSGPNIEVVEYTENLVTITEFREFLDVPEENSKSKKTLRLYLEEAETMVNLAIPTLADTSTSTFIKRKRTLIILKAGLLYFANSDMNSVDPNKRNPKIELWSKLYKETLQSLATESSTSSENGTGLIRRKKHSDYSDENSYLYGTD